MENRSDQAADTIKTSVTTTISTEQRIECQEHQRLLCRACRRGPLLWCKSGKHEVCVPWEQWERIRQAFQDLPLEGVATIEHVIEQERVIGRAAPTEGEGVG